MPADSVGPTNEALLASKQSTPESDLDKALASTPLVQSGPVDFELIVDLGDTAELPERFSRHLLLKIRAHLTTDDHASIIGHKADAAAAGEVRI